MLRAIYRRIVRSLGHSLLALCLHAIDPLELVKAKPDSVTKSFVIKPENLSNQHIIGISPTFDSTSFVLFKISNMN